MADPLESCQHDRFAESQTRGVGPEGAAACLRLRACSVDAISDGDNGLAQIHPRNEGGLTTTEELPTAQAVGTLESQ